MRQLGDTLEDVTYGSRKLLADETFQNIQRDVKQRAANAFSTLEQTGDTQAYVTELGNIDQWQAHQTGQAGAAAMKPFQNQTFRDFGRRLDFSGLLRGAQMGGHNELMQWVEMGIRARNATAADQWDKYKFDTQMRLEAEAAAENRRRYEEQMRFAREKESNDAAYQAAMLELNARKADAQQGRANDATVVRLIREGYSPEAALAALEGGLGADPGRTGGQWEKWE